MQQTQNIVPNQRQSPHEMAQQQNNKLLGQESVSQQSDTKQQQQQQQQVNYLLSIYNFIFTYFNQKLNLHNHKTFFILFYFILEINQKIDF